MSVNKQILRDTRTYAEAILVGGDKEMKTTQHCMPSDTNRILFRSNAYYHALDIVALTTTPVQGSVIFAGASQHCTEDNTNFFWDNTNKRLGIGLVTPGAILANPAITMKGIHIENTDDAAVIIEGDVPLFYMVDTGGDVSKKVFRISTDDGYTLFSSRNDGLSLTRMLISMNHITGNIGLGYNPQDWHTNFCAVDMYSSNLSGITASWAFDLNGVVYHTYNLKWDLTNNRLETSTSNPASYVYQSGTTWSFYACAMTAPGNPLTFIRPFTIWSNGTSGLVEVNQDNKDVDFVVNGDTSDNVFYVDAGIECVGIGKQPTAYRLEMDLATNDFAIEDCIAAGSIGDQIYRLKVRVGVTEGYIPIYDVGA